MKKLLRKPMALLLVLALLMTNLGLVAAMAGENDSNKEETAQEEEKSDDAGKDEKEETKEKETTPKVEAPTSSVKDGTYEKAQKITLSTKTKDATIYYTTDGKAPTAKSTKYAKSIEIAKTTTIKAIAVKKDMTDSNVSTFKYTIKADDEKDSDDKDEDTADASKTKAAAKDDDADAAHADEATIAAEPEEASEDESSVQAAVTSADVTVDLTVGAAFPANITAGSTATNPYQSGDSTKYTVAAATFANAAGQSDTTITAEHSYTVTLTLVPTTDNTFEGITAANVKLNNVAASSVITNSGTTPAGIDATFTLTAPKTEVLTVDKTTESTKTDISKLTKMDMDSEIKLTYGADGSAEADHIQYKLNDAAEWTSAEGNTATVKLSATDSEGLTKVTARAVKNGITIASTDFYYNMNVPALEASLKAGTHTGAQKTTLKFTKTAPTNVVIRYTTDGSEPTATTGTEYVTGSEIEISKSLTLKAKAFTTHNSSELLSVEYTIKEEEPVTPTKKKITSVKVTKLDRCVKGNAPDTKASVSGKGYKISSIKWYEMETEDNNGTKTAGARLDQVESIFRANCYYGPYITLKAEDGYEFDMEVFKKGHATTSAEVSNYSSAVGVYKADESEIVLYVVWPAGSGTTANAANNTITGLKSSYTTNEKVTFIMTGATTSAEDGNERYIPVSYKISNTSKDLGNSDNTSIQGTITRITSAGTYTLTVTYQKQVYDAEAETWVDEADSLDTKSATIRVTAASTASTTRTATTTAKATTTAAASSTSKASNASTNDSTPVGAIIAVLVIAGAAVVILAVKKKKSK